MALPTSWGSVAGGTVNFSYSGLSFSFRIYIDGYYQKLSNTSARVHIRGYVDNPGPNGWSGTNKTYRLWITNNVGTTIWDTGTQTDSATLYAGEGHYFYADGTKDVSPGENLTYHLTYSVPAAGASNTIAGAAGVPTFVSPPSSLSFSVTGRTYKSFTANTVVGNWGGGSSCTRVFKVLKAQYTGGQDALGKTSTSSSTGNVSITVGTGNYDDLVGTAFDVKGAGGYYLGLYAANEGGATRYGPNTVYYTPPAPLASITQSQSGSNTANSVTHTIKIKGGASTINNSNAVTTQYRYSTDGGSSYISWTNISGTASAWVEKSFTFTSTYGASIKVQARQVYQSQYSETKELGYTALSTTAPSGNTISVVSTTWHTVTVNASISSWGRPNAMSGRDLRPGVGANTSTYGKWNQNTGNVMSLTNNVISNSSPAGSLTIKGCQTLYPFCYATNGLVSSNTWGSVFYTNPAPLQTLNLTSSPSQQAGKVNIGIAITVGNSTNNENVNVTTEYRYAVDSTTYSAWTSLGTGTPWTQKTTTIVVNENASVTVQARQSYQSKYSEIKQASINVPHYRRLYAPVNGQSRRIRKILVPNPQDGGACPVRHLYAPDENGLSRLVYDNSQ